MIVMYLVLLGLVIYFSVFRHQKIAYNGTHNRRSATTESEAVTGSSQSSDDRETKHDVIIVGAGVAGAALASALAKDGRCVRVIERDLSEPNTIAGELLQPGGYLKLIELGLEGMDNAYDCVENIDAQRVIGCCIFKDGNGVRLPYPLEIFASDVAGRGFHNGRFVMKLREKAAALPNVRLEQGTVTSLLKENGAVKGVRYRTNNGDEKAYAPLTIVCDGCFSNLRRSLCSPKVDIASHSVGLILEVENRQMPYSNYGLIVIADPSLIGLYPISSTEVRCLVDVPASQKIPSVEKGEMAKYLKSAVAHQVPPEFYESFVAAVDKGELRIMPNRIMPTTPEFTPGALLMGDAFNMRHGLTAGGMTVALSDVVILRNLLRHAKDLNDTKASGKYLESFYILRKPMAFTINTLSQVLYNALSTSLNEAQEEWRDVHFAYVSSRRMAFSNSLMALVSGLKPRPLSLVALVFTVAVYGFGRVLLPVPSPKRLWLGVRMLMGAAGIAFPIMKAEGLGQVLFQQLFPHITEVFE